MAITVNYAPAASTLGQAGFMAGRGEYATDERRYRDKMDLATQELLQNERMQQRQIQATARNNLINQTAAAQRQMLGLQADMVSQARQQQAREKMAVFDQYAGMRNRYQQAQLQSALGMQEAYQQNWLGAQDDMRRQMMLQNQMEMQQNIAEQEQQEKIQFAQQQAAQKRQAILDDGRRKVQAIMTGIESNRIPRQSGMNAIAQLEDEMASKAAGVEWETEIPVGLTPQEELKREFDQSHVMFEGQPFVKDSDGDWMVPRGYSMPEPSQEEQQRIESAKAEQEMEIKQREMIADLEEKKLDYELKLFDKFSEQMSPSTFDADGNEVPGQPLYTTEQAIQMARERAEAAFAGRIPDLTTPGPTATPPPQMSVPPGAPPQAAAPQGQAQPGPAYGSDWIPDVDPATGEPLPAQVATEDYVYEREANLNAAPEDRPPVSRMSDLDLVGAVGNLQVRPPSNLTDRELHEIGESAVTVDSERKLVPESSRPLVNALAGLEVDGEMAQARNVVAGAYAAYGPKVEYWPKAVLAQTVAARAIVKEAVASNE